MSEAWNAEAIAEYHIKAYIGSYGNYNAGSLRGGWLEFPVSEQKLDQFLKDVVGINEFNEEVMIQDYDGNLFDLGESENVYKINQMAAIWEDLWDDEKNKVIAYADYQGGDLSPDELMNLMLQADEIPFYSYNVSGMTLDDMVLWSNEEKLGYTIAEESGLSDQLEQFGSAVFSAFDFEKYGAAMAMDLELFDDGYLDCTAKDIDLEYYSTEELAQEAQERFPELTEATKDTWAIATYESKEFNQTLTISSCEDEHSWIITDEQDNEVKTFDDFKNLYSDLVAYVEEDRASDINFIDEDQIKLWSEERDNQTRD